jgi:hypothetical protein
MDIHSKETKHTTHEKAARTTHEKTAYLTKKKAYLTKYKCIIRSRQNNHKLTLNCWISHISILLIHEDTIHIKINFSGRFLFLPDPSYAYVVSSAIINEERGDRKSPTALPRREQ